MNFIESIFIALGAIRSNKLRAGLTLLSISIGVFAIIMATSAVSALDSKIDEQLSSLGRNSFFITKTPTMEMGNSWRKYLNRKDITLQQGMAMKERLTSAEFVGVLNQIEGVTAKFEDKKTDPNVTVVGTDEVYLVNGDYTVSQGRGLDIQDVHLASDVTVIGADIAEKLFKGSNPLGRTITLNNYRYTVVGVLAAKGAIFGQSQDNFVALPITSAVKHFLDEWNMSVMLFIRSKGMDDLQETVDQATGLMRTIRRVPLGADNDFEVSTNESISDTFGGLTSYVSSFGLICGVFALVAAGVGIMNIMLVSVKERTREIGIRKAIGATRWSVMGQFIIEAVTLCLVGATIGTVMGIGGGAILGALIGATVSVPWLWLGIAYGSCTLIGLVFGSYPAWKASRLDPIDALRYE